MVGFFLNRLCRFTDLLFNRRIHFDDRKIITIHFERTFFLWKSSCCKICLLLKISIRIATTLWRSSQNGHILFRSINCLIGFLLSAQKWFLIQRVQLIKVVRLKENWRHFYNLQFMFEDSIPISLFIFHKFFLCAYFVICNVLHIY